MARHQNIDFLSHTYNDDVPVPVVVNVAGYNDGNEYAHLTGAGILINAEFLRLPFDIFRGLAASIVEDYHLARAINTTMRVEPLTVKCVVPDTVGFYDRWRKGDKEQGRVGSRCMICMEDFRSGQKIRHIHNHPNCVFHRKCINTWFKVKPRCPACNVDVESYDDGGNAL